MGGGPLGFAPTAPREARATSCEPIVPQIRFCRVLIRLCNAESSSVVLTGVTLDPNRAPNVEVPRRPRSRQQRRHYNDTLSHERHFVQDADERMALAQQAARAGRHARRVRSSSRVAGDGGASLGLAAITPSSSHLITEIPHPGTGSSGCSRSEGP